MKTATQERRRFIRNEPPPHFGISLLQPQGSIDADTVNFSEGGLCLRLQEMLEIRSLVRLRLTPEGSGSRHEGQPLQCTGRVAWVVQRLDLRNSPPFLFDVGIEFVDPPPILRQLIAQKDSSPASAPRAPATRQKTLDSWTSRSRVYVPYLERLVNHSLPWHLVVMVDGVPCFSGHYPSERTALAAWAQFKRDQAKRS